MLCFFWSESLHWQCIFSKAFRICLKTANKTDKCSFMVLTNKSAKSVLDFTCGLNGKLNACGTRPQRGAPLFEGCSVVPGCFFTDWMIRNLEIMRILDYLWMPNAMRCDGNLLALHDDPIARLFHSKIIDMTEVILVAGVQWFVFHENSPKSYRFMENVEIGDNLSSISGELLRWLLRIRNHRLISFRR